MTDKKTETAAMAAERKATMAQCYGKNDLADLRKAQANNTTVTKATPNHSNRSSDYRGRRK